MARNDLAHGHGCIEDQRIGKQIYDPGQNQKDDRIAEVNRDTGRKQKPDHAEGDLQIVQGKKGEYGEK